MPVAYTPGLTIAARTIVRRQRRLPVKGETIVQVGQRVSASDVLARAELPGPITSLKVSELLGIEPSELPHHLNKQVGEEVREGEIIGEARSFFGLFHSESRAPVSGVIEHMSPLSGHVAIRQPPTVLELEAYISGVIVEVAPQEGATVETPAALVQGIFGVGGERRGLVRMLASSPGDTLRRDSLNESARGCVIIGGASADAQTLLEAARLGASAVVVGSVSDEDLRAYVGRDIGVAVTGQEEVGAALILTEGFGSLNMAARTFDLLRSLEGKLASVNGATQIRAGVIRPEIIVPAIDEAADADSSRGRAGQPPQQELRVGGAIRVIREPYFGSLGTVVELPPELQTIETEARVRVARVRLEDGREVTVPRANLEIVQTG
jgi:hypothetical protein